MQIRSCFLLALLLASGHGLLADVLYSVADLGTLGGNNSFGSGINNAGQVTGWSATSTGSNHAFLYSNGQMMDLGTLDGNNSFGFGINKAGQVTGSSDTSTGTSHAFLYSNGQMQDLGIGAGYGINDTGQVTGSTGTVPTSSDTHAFLYSNGELMDLGTLGGVSSVGHGINNAGQVTGSVYESVLGVPTHAFLSSNGEITPLPPNSEGQAINNAGQVTGDFLARPYEYHAFLYIEGRFMDLGTLFPTSIARYTFATGEAINDNGQVVGASGVQLAVAFLYSNGQLMTLDNLIDPTLGIHLNAANGINNQGQIAANGANGRAYLLTPIPEPSTFALFVVAAVGLWLRPHCSPERLKAS